MTARDLYRAALSLRGIPRAMQREAEVYVDSFAANCNITMDYEIPHHLLPLMKEIMSQIADDTFGDLRERQ
jgi:hypothetical protein